MVSYCRIAIRFFTRDVASLNSKSKIEQSGVVKQKRLEN